MRISDWSSDVCSSDLDHAAEFDLELTEAHGADNPAGAPDRQFVAGGQGALEGAGDHRFLDLDLAAESAGIGHLEQLALLQGGQLGRASCRDQVCHSV